MRCLIFGTSYVAGQHARYLFTLWRELVLKLNPDMDVLVVDSASPHLPSTEGLEVIQLGDNIGHLKMTGRDGWGRAFTAGIQRAIDGKYDWAVHIETDLLFAQPVQKTLDRMGYVGVEVSAPMAYPYWFMETGLMFMSVPFMRGFAEAYDWEKSPAYPVPEERCEALFGDAFFQMPLRGCRNDTGQMTAKGMARGEYGRVDWLTHCADPAVYREFLKANGHG
jgi:hypothetical protein